jgi:hypothetical protein
MECCLQNSVASESLMALRSDIPAGHERRKRLDGFSQAHCETSFAPAVGVVVPVGQMVQGTTGDASGSP